MSNLKAPFKTSQIRWRVGSVTKDKSKGMGLAYVDARDIENRLDEVVGATGWSTRYEYHGNTCICYLTIGGTTKANGAAETKIEAEKGAISKAFVRVASSWGIGRYLYDTKNVWVEIDEYGKIKKSEKPQLDTAHDTLVKSLPKDLTDDEKFDAVREAIKKRTTVEQIDTYYEKVKAGVEGMSGDYPKQVETMIQDRKNEITGSVGE